MKPKESAKRHQTISWVIPPVTMYRQMESVYVQKFQRLINGTLSSGEFSKSFAKKMEDVGAHSASGFIDQWVWVWDCKWRGYHPRYTVFALIYGMVKNNCRTECQIKLLNPLDRWQIVVLLLSTLYKNGYSKSVLGSRSLFWLQSDKFYYWSISLFLSCSTVFDTCKTALIYSNGKEIFLGTF